MKIIECPRDAIQGIEAFIPTKYKAAYINQLLHAGFDTIDFGSFVSPKAIPQLADTTAVLSKLSFSGSATKLLAIVANEQGAQAACRFDEITYLGFPFSVSETFQKRNTGATISESVDRVRNIQKRCKACGKQLVIYISMGFGNPYGDVWNAQVVMKWVNKLSSFGIKIFSIADTVGCATPNLINYLIGHLMPSYPGLEFGLHLHTDTGNWEEKVAAAYNNGVRRFDSAILGYGGCPMAGPVLAGNLPTDKLLRFMAGRQIDTGISSSVISMLEDSFQQLINSKLCSLQH
jgi:hydroxymethylglutaryl-CoA lyase